MDRKEAENLISTLSARFREIGEPDLAHQDRYYWEGEEGHRRREEPHKRLMLMIRALELRLALLDRSTYERALQAVRSSGGESLERVDVAPIGDAISGADYISLEQLPDLSSLRARLNELAFRVADDDQQGSA